MLVILRILKKDFKNINGERFILHEEEFHGHSFILKNLKHGLKWLRKKSKKKERNTEVSGISITSRLEHGA